jgi:hypothetical protein
VGQVTVLHVSNPSLIDSAMFGNGIGVAGRVQDSDDNQFGLKK